jgi:hypothetical protein
MTDRADPHDGWTPEPQEEIQPGDPWRDPGRAERGVTPLTADLPCGHAFIGGSHCKSRDLAWHDGSKGKHAYVPWERRKGERRTLDAATPRPGLVEALETLLPDALAEADDAGSDADDWRGSEYVMRLAAGIASRLASDTGEPGLNVERLARSLRALEARDELTVADGFLGGRDDGDYVTFATSIAAAYANDKGADPTPEPKP